MQCAVALNAAAASYMGPTFPAPFPHFDPSTTALLQTAYAGPHVTPTGTTYYATPPFFYWPYSSPHMSPNTCYNHQNPHTAATPLAATAYHQTMYSLDLLSTQINFAKSATPAPLSPHSLPAQAVVPTTPNKPHTISECAETYVTPMSPPKAHFMTTLLQFKQISTPTVAEPKTTTNIAVDQKQSQNQNQNQNQCNQQISSEHPVKSEDCCTDIPTTNEILSIDTNTDTTSQTTFSMVTRPHNIGRTKQSVHKVC